MARLCSTRSSSAAEVIGAVFAAVFVAARGGASAKAGLVVPQVQSSRPSHRALNAAVSTPCGRDRGREIRQDRHHKRAPRLVFQSGKTERGRGLSFRSCRA